MNNRELDAKMGELMGWKRLSIHTWRSPEDGHRYWPDFSTDIAAAMLVVEKMRERSLHINIISQEDDYLITVSKFLPHFNCYSNVGESIRVDNFKELPEAICRSALKAVEDK